MTSAERSPPRHDRVISSRTAGEHISLIEYEVSSGTLRSLKAGEKVTQVTRSSGVATEYYLRWIAGKWRTVEVRGECSCGPGDFTVYDYDAAGRVVRELHALGSITVYQRDGGLNGRLLSKTEGYRNASCPAESEPYCYVSDTDELATATLDGTDAVTTSYQYDPLWPEKVMATCRDSVVQPGGSTCSTNYQ